MNRVLIVGYFGFGNFGDEWLLINLIKLIKKFSKNKIEISLLYNNNEYKVINNIQYIPRWKIFWLIKTICKVDKVIYCGGLFQDYSSVFSFLYYLFIFFLSKLFFKKVILLNTEFSFRKIPYFVRYILSYISDFVVFRNDIELKKIKKFINKNKFIFSPDICYIEENIVEKNKLFLKNFKKIGLIIKSEKKDKDLLKNFCESLAKKHHLIFIPFHLEEDYKFILGITKDIKNCEIRVWDRIENYKYIFEDIDLVITSRLHGVVLSDNLKLPFICFSEQEKIRNFILSIYKSYPPTLNELRIASLSDFIIYPNLKNNFTTQIEETFRFLATLKYI
ncbi:MAG: polysaccharide pyruvyl transferase family protein [Elusimicrobiota bacterium]|nr:polysaccharide pyruvyl transferase family protein [Endomicrobiia bacterium]MDW8165745.1 polysaccharide pyruvyl transferase family protein [Elusimicrobiota bacterium]